MPDIGLLQGPPRGPRVAIVGKPPEAVPSPAPVPAPPPVPALLIADAVADAPRGIRLAAHAAVVSQDEPIATLHGAAEEALHAGEPGIAAGEPQPDLEPAVAAVPEPILPQAAALRAEPALTCAAIAASAADAAIAAGAAGAAGEESPPSASPAGPLSLASPPSAPAPDYRVPPIRGRDLLWLLLALVLIVGTGLGIRDPWPADEPRFASLARDLVQSGEWLFPRVGGDLYQDKPPLFFWTLALCYSLFGGFKGWFLIPALLSAAGVLFLVYDFGRRTVGRDAGLGAAIAVSCTLQFVLAFRGAQIDPFLCLLTTFSLYAFLRQLLLGDGWRWYVAGGFAAGLGVFTKGVGFLPLLVVIPFFALRAFRWNGLATLDAGRGGWRWWLAPLAMLLAISLWFVPMLLAVAASDSPEYAAYRDEILFKQTVGRYAAAWHHVKGWYYFLVEVIPPLWLPWSLLLFWLVPRFKAAFVTRDARVWLPLCWVLLVVLFFSMSPGKRGIYLMPALPALALASLPVLPAVFARRGVRVAGWTLALGFWLAGLITLVLVQFDLLGFATRAGLGTLAVKPMLIAFVVLGAAALLFARLRASLAAWPAVLAALCIAFSWFLAPRMNGERSGKDFVRAVLAQVAPGEELGLVAYKEQFLLYLDRPSFNFGHRRWQEGPQEYFDAAAWLNAGAHRVLLVPEEALAPKDRFDPTQPAIPCFTRHVSKAGSSSGDDWYLVRAPAERACAALGDASRAIRYH